MSLGNPDLNSFLCKTWLINVLLKISLYEHEIPYIYFISVLVCLYKCLKKS